MVRLSTLRIAWRNLGRNRRRTLLAVGAIALGQFTLVFVNGMMAGMFHDMLHTITGPLVGHVQVQHADWREERATDLTIGNLAQVRKEIESRPHVVGTAPRVYSAVLAAPGEKRDQPADAEPAMVLGLDVAVESRDGGVLDVVVESGEGVAPLHPDDLPKGRKVVVGRVLANRLGVSAGEQLAVIGQDAEGFPVADLFDIGAVIPSDLEIVQTRGIVMDIAVAGEFLAMPDRAHQLAIHGDDHANADAIAADVVTLPALAEAEVLTWREAVPELARIMDMKDWMDFFFIAIVFVAAAAGIANTAMMSTFERTHEFGMLLAMGIRPRRVVGMVLVESVVLGLVGVAVGSILGATVVLITGHTGLDYSVMAKTQVSDVAFSGLNISYMIYPRFEWRHVLFGLYGVTITSVLASVWPAMIAARLEPMEAMRT